MEKILSVFVDESGVFGELDSRLSFYYVSMVFHDQSIDISDNINTLNNHIKNLNYPMHAIHTGPLIRRENCYQNDLMEHWKALFNTLYHFARRLDIKYLCASVDKSECVLPINVDLAGRLSKKISQVIHNNYSYFLSFDKIIVYYDNGQVELSKILSSVFNILFSNVEFRRVKPIDYKLFQVADLICTVELIKTKVDKNILSKSEYDFFGSSREFKKNIYKNIFAKKMS